MKHFMLLLLVIVFCLILLKSAWICDDAYISLRTVDNFVNGFGLRWNVSERVQTFTNPLWTLLLSLIYNFTREAYLTTILFSMAVSLCGVLLFVYKAANKHILAATLGVLLFCTSKAFIDYSTSGLENPLLHVLIVAFYWVYFRFETGFQKLFWLCSIASLCAFNRMDSVLLCAPALVLSFISLPGKWKARKRLFYALSGLLPFILWEVFAVIYYGFPFPNTAYAKLNTGIPASDLLVQGLYYLADSFTRDPITLLVILLCGLAVILKKDGPGLAAFAGVLLYLLYVLKIGGDFMSGRFLAAPFCASVVILTGRFQHFATPKKVAPIFAVILLIALLNPVSPMRTDINYEDRTLNAKGISDERGWYYRGTGLLVDADVKKQLDNRVMFWRAMGKEFKMQHREKPVRVFEAIGCVGYYSGPNVHIIDRLGICDPFLARIKPDLNSGWRFGMPTKTGWRIGHYYRHLPEGYIETRRHKQNRLANPGLAKLYDGLSIITSGDLFSAQRWIEIWKFNTGHYSLP